MNARKYVQQLMTNATQMRFSNQDIRLMNFAVQHPKGFTPKMYQAATSLNDTTSRSDLNKFIARHLLFKWKSEEKSPNHKPVVKYALSSLGAAQAIELFPVIE